MNLLKRFSIYYKGGTFNMTYKVEGKEFEDWTEAQDEAVRLLNDGVEWVQIMQGDGLLQELNLEQGIEPKPHFSTSTLAPYYWRLRYG